jgi:frataxin-like iron-binding protein CyaY
MLSRLRGGSLRAARPAATRSLRLLARRPLVAPTVRLRSPAWAQFGSSRCWLSTAAHAEAGSTISTIHAALNDAKGACSDTFEPALSADGIMSLDLGDKGQYSLQPDGERLLLFSPVVGPKHYTWDAANGWWSSPEDGHLLVELLVRELMHSTSVCINL